MLRLRCINHEVEKSLFWQFVILTQGSLGINDLQFFVGYDARELVGKMVMLDKFKINQ